MTKETVKPVKESGEIDGAMLIRPLGSLELWTTHRRLAETAERHGLSWEWDHPDWNEAWGPDDPVVVRLSGGEIRFVDEFGERWTPPIVLDDGSGARGYAAWLELLLSEAMRIDARVDFWIDPSGETYIVVVLPNGHAAWVPDYSRLTVFGMDLRRRLEASGLWLADPPELAGRNPRTMWFVKR